MSRVKTLYSHVLGKWNVDCYIGENKEVNNYQIDTCLLCSQVHRYTCNFGSFLDVYRFHYYDKVQRHMDLHLKVHKQEAHGKHCSHEKHFLSKNKLEQSHDYKNMLVKTLYRLISKKRHCLVFEKPWITFAQICFVPNWLKLPSGFDKEDFKMTSMHFRYFAIISPWKPYTIGKSQYWSRFIRYIKENTCKLERKFPKTFPIYYIMGLRFK